MLLDCLGHTVGEVLPAVGDHVPGDAVLGGEGTGAGTQPGEGGQVRAQPQVQRDAGAVDTQLWRKQYIGDSWLQSVSGRDISDDKKYPIILVVRDREGGCQVM